MNEPTWPPRGPEDLPPGPWHRGWRQGRLQRRHGWHGWWNGQPPRRDLNDRLVGGVAAGLARCSWRNPTMVRIALIIAALFTQGVAVPLYCIAWLLIPEGASEPGDDAGSVPGERPGAVPSSRTVLSPGTVPPSNTVSLSSTVPSSSAGPSEGAANIWSRARHDSRGLALAVGAASLVTVILLLCRVFNATLLETYGWPQVATAGCLVLIWRNGSDRERAGLRRYVAPLENLGQEGTRTRRVSTIRIGIAGVLFAAGIGFVLSSQETFAVVRPLFGVVLVIGAFVILFGPWWLRIARDLVLERQARARAEERADMAARIHDSVLQTLALIQRRSDDPAQVTQLARAQERELRSWLFEGRAPGSMPEVASIAEGIRRIQQDVEARHGVPVEVVTVGDCPLSDDLGALLEAAREAVVNAAKWSQAPVVSLFAEVTGQDVEVVVRDRGRGFDPAAVPTDRKGMAESIHGRMTRHGGTVTVQTGVGEGTKVSLKMPLGVVRSAT